jgi:hypothetical protein
VDMTISQIGYDINGFIEYEQLKTNLAEPVSLKAYYFSETLKEKVIGVISRENEQLFFSGNDVSDIVVIEDNKQLFYNSAAQNPERELSIREVDKIGKHYWGTEKVPVSLGDSIIPFKRGIYLGIIHINDEY